MCLTQTWVSGVIAILTYMITFFPLPFDRYI